MRPLFTTLLALLLVSPAAAENRIEYEFSIAAGLNGQPDFGFPGWITASPDGKHVYVTTFPPGVSLHTFERLESSLRLVDTIRSGDSGISFSPVGLDITDDGRYLLLASFSGPNAVHVFQRDTSTGRLTLVQTITHPDLNVVDGVTAAEGGMAWGRPPVGQTGGVFVPLARSGGGSGAAPRAAADPPFAAGASEKLPEVISTASAPRASNQGTLEAFAVLTADRVIVFTEAGKCTLLLTDVRSLTALDPATRFKEVGVEILIDNRTASIHLGSDRGQSVYVDVVLDDCRITYHRVFQPPSLPDHETAAVYDAKAETRSGPGDPQASVAAGRDTDDDTFFFGSRESLGDLTIFFTAEPPPKGRVIDLAATGFSPVRENGIHGIAAEESFAYAYATVPSPPMIHALRLVLEGTGAGPGSPKRRRSVGRK
jgi:hypothetical protein